MTLNFLPLGIIEVSVGPTRSLAFFPARGKLVSEQQRGPLLLERLVVGRMVSAPCDHLLPQKLAARRVLGNGAEAAMPQPRRVGRGDLLNHTNDFFHTTHTPLFPPPPGFVFLCDT